MLFDIIYIVVTKGTNEAVVIEGDCCALELHFRYKNRCDCMLVSLPSRRLVLIDENSMPRFWAAVWAEYHGGGLAQSTLEQKLRHIDAFYCHCEAVGGALDDALSGLDFNVLSAALETFFLTLRNKPQPNQTIQACWNSAFHFVRETCERLERNPALANRMEDIRARMAQLDRTFLGLRPFRRHIGRKIRALPRKVLLEVMEAVTPGSCTNPFARDKTQWRIYCLIILLLFQGLRRGEALSLHVNSFKSEIDDRDGRTRWRISVQTNEAEDDPRATAPSIKTAQSIRTIPMTARSAEVLLSYAENHRGAQDTPYLLCSAHAKPLSESGVTRALQRLSEALSADCRDALLEATGTRSLSAHAFRHTSAVIRMTQLLEAGKSHDQAMQHLRSFFGWSRNSTMPLVYAKAALDERLNDFWSDRMDDRLNFLRALPE